MRTLYTLVPATAVHWKLSSLVMIIFWTAGVTAAAAGVVADNMHASLSADGLLCSACQHVLCTV